MIHILIFALTLGGFLLLFLAMPRHQQDWMKQKLPAALGRLFRYGGFSLLALAFLAAGRVLGWSYGSVVWFGWLSVGAAIVVAGNVNRERIIAKVRK